MRLDKTRKMPIYAQHGLPVLWLIDPIAMTLEVLKLESGKWVLLGAYGENDKVRVEPFQEIELDLGHFWME